MSIDNTRGTFEEFVGLTIFRYLWNTSIAVAFEESREVYHEIS